MLGIILWGACAVVALGTLRYVQCRIPEVDYMSDAWISHTRVQLYKPGRSLRGQINPEPLGTGILKRG